MPYGPNPVGLGVVKDLGLIEPGLSCPWQSSPVARRRGLSSWPGVTLFKFSI